MNKIKKATVAVVVALLALITTAASCESDADIASQNLSTAAEQFEVQRLIVGVNGITDEILFSVEGRCSIDRGSDALVVTCKHGPDDYRKHYIGLSDNVSYVVTQLEGIDVSVYHTRIVLKPTTILPDYDLAMGEQ